jgi:hypothetical protein
MTVRTDERFPLLVHLGSRLALFSPEGRELASIPLPRDDAELRRATRGSFAPQLLDWARKLPYAAKGSVEPTAGDKTIISVTDPMSRMLVRKVGIVVHEADVGLVRRVRSSAFSSLSPDTLLTVATIDLRETLASGEEQVMALSRECDRLERLLRREDELTGYLRLSSVPGTPIEHYLGGADAATEAMRKRFVLAEKHLSVEVAKLLPNTSKLLGTRTAARLLVSYPSIPLLSRISASRIQLVGARRRSVGHGPRYGLIYLAEGMDRVPPSRRGALARTLASLATVALRADLMTHSDVSVSLTRKKEERITELCKSKGGRQREAPGSARN